MNREIKMIREIKFRGKCQRPENGEWIYGALATTWMNKSVVIMPKCYFISRDLGEVDDDGEIIFSDQLALGGFIKVIPESIGQFTGVKDNKEIEIYEGDIIRRTISIQGETKTFIETVFNIPGHFATKEVHEAPECAIVLSNYLGHKIEVIGNIHDNPELLK